MLTKTLSITTVADILGIVPTLLGLVPTDSVVVVATKAGQVVVTGRVDVPPAWVGLDAMAAHVARAAGGVGADAAHIVGYHTGPDCNAIPLVNLLCEVLPEVGVSVAPPIYVTGDQASGEAVYQCLCTDPGCPPTGPVPPPTQIEGVLAAAVSRQAIVDQVAAGPRAAAVGEAMTHLSGRMNAEDAEAALQTVFECDSVDQLTDTQIAMAAHALRVERHQVRAAIGLPMTAEEAEFAGVRQRLAENPSRIDRLIEMAACLPDNRATPCLEVLAANAYWHGNGALANIALERIGSRRVSWLGELIDNALVEGVSPDNP